MPAIDSIEQQRIQQQTADSLDPESTHLRGFSQTAPQVAFTVSPFDGELGRPALQGQKFYQLARLIRLDPTVRLVRDLVMAPAMRAGWQYESDDDAPPDAVEKVKKQFEPLRLQLLRTSMAGMLDYGYTPYEVWPDGAWNICVKPLYVDYTTILVNAVDGTFWGLKQQPQYTATGSQTCYLTRQECFIVAQDVEAQNFYGNATLRSLVEAYYETQAINSASRKYDAKVAGTHWVIYYPLGKSMFNGVETDNGEIAKALLGRAESVGGIIVPRSILQAIDTLSLQAASSEATQWKIELLSDKGAGQMAFENKLKYLDVLKVRAFGMPERAILEGQYGTKAEAETHADIAIANLEVRHQMLCDVYNCELVNRYLTWHYGPEARDSVWIKPAPIDDLALAFNRQLYMQLLTDPAVMQSELTNIDMGALRGGLEIPVIEHDEESNEDWLEELGLETDLLTELGLSNFDPNQTRRSDGQWAKDTGGGSGGGVSTVNSRKYPRDIFFRAKNGDRFVIQQGGPNSFMVFDSNDIQVGSEYASLEEAQKVAQNFSTPAAQPYFPTNWRDTAQTAEYYGSTITQMPDGKFEVMTANGNIYIRPTLDEAMGAADQHLRGVDPNDRVGPARHVYQQFRDGRANTPENYRGSVITPAESSSNRVRATDATGGDTYHDTIGEAREYIDRHSGAKEKVLDDDYHGYTLRQTSIGTVQTISPDGNDTIAHANIERAQQYVDRQRDNSQEYRGHTITRDDSGRLVTTSPGGYTQTHNSMADLQRNVDTVEAPSENGGTQSYIPEGREKHKLGDKEIYVNRDDDVTTADLRKVNKNLTLARAVALVGPQDGAEVTVYKPGEYDSGVVVTVDHPDYTAERRINSDGTIDNMHFKKKSGSTAKGIGVAVVYDQVSAAVKQGFKELNLLAAGSGTGTHELNRDGNYNGYYTWPRMGYDADLEGNYNPELQSHINKKGAKRVSDLMRDDLGRYLWQKHGRGMNMSFDLTKGSLSRKMLSAYYKETRKKNG